MLISFDSITSEAAGVYRMTRPASCTSFLFLSSLMPLNYRQRKQISYTEKEKPLKRTRNSAHDLVGECAGSCSEKIWTRRQLYIYVKILAHGIGQFSVVYYLLLIPAFG